MAGVKSFDSHEPGIQLLRYDDKTIVLTERCKDYANYIGGNVKPDIIIYNPKNNKYAVFDVKYKDSSNARFSRSDRMQVLAYGLMFDADNVGNIFPTQNGTSSLYYKSNRINSIESRTRMYHQLEIAIDRSWIFAMTSKDGGESIHLMKYLQGILE